jgi:hypothetical protein
MRNCLKQSDVITKALFSPSPHKINAIEKAFSSHRFHILFELSMQESSLKRRKYLRKSLRGQLLVSHYQINLQNERRDEYKLRMKPPST